MTLSLPLKTVLPFGDTASVNAKTLSAAKPTKLPTPWSSSVVPPTLPIPSALATALIELPPSAEPVKSPRK